ncbi:MAG: hypothetical protein ACOYJC_11285 [Christensenellales bacterium]
MAKRIKKKRNWGLIIGVILFLSLLLSLVFAFYRLISMPQYPAAGEKSRGDYLLMVVQCMLGLVVMFLPSFIQKKWRIGIPNYMYVAYFIFLFCAIYLGEIRNFYYLIPHWDTILHTFSGMMLGALGFTLVTLLNDEPSVRLNLSPRFIALFAFCFALALGALWEIYEYTVDGVLSLNMQKYMLADGTQLVGRAALTDTMKDIVVDAIGALVVSIAGYYMLKKTGKKKEEDTPKEQEPS